jgi:adenine-specific DNA-methyltransferase
VSRLTDLIAQAKAKDPQLGVDLDREFRVLSERLPFGLNFERHRPEAVELPRRPIRKGDKVRVLPTRGSSKKGDQRLWQVKAIRKTGDGKVADLEMLDADDAQTQTVALDDLAVVAEFRDTIYPGLVSTGKVQRGGDKPFHTVINGENYHVLKALTYTHRGKVDAIYIDPPYNTGAKDWKYNNDYVEGDDLYRHSKWLAMMERRLLVAKELLNPAASVLIVTIDEKEYLRLGLLLEQLFPDAQMRMISTEISRKGSARSDDFARVDEYIFIVMFGTASVGQFFIDGISVAPAGGRQERLQVAWESMLRRGTGSMRTDSHLKFYPVLVDPSLKQVVGRGDVLPLDQHPSDYKAAPGLIAIWPMRSNGAEGRWQLNTASFSKQLSQGHIKAGRFNEDGTCAILYLPSGLRTAIAEKKIVLSGTDQNGGPEYQWIDPDTVTGRPKTQWHAVSHNASEYGTALLKRMLPDRRFPFPKSVYAIEDVIHLFVSKKHDAIILDFFSGSGSTAHAVMRLNRQDNGCRQCISVTNNEVTAEEQKALRDQGLRPGDPDWEKWGICDYVTKPRVQAAITGNTPDGEPIKGDYKFTDKFPIAEGFKENAEFFTLTYETPVSVNHNRAFARIAPLLWLRAGCRGRRIDKLPDLGWEVVEAYGLLVDVDSAAPFCKAVNKTKGLRIAFIVTDDDRRFQAIARRLPDGVEPVRLYESYLTNFSFANGE